MDKPIRALRVPFLLILLVFFVARYGSLPRIGFTLDDWSLLNRAEAFDSAKVLLTDSMKHPARPVGSLMLMADYRLYGEHIGRYVADCIVGFAVFLGLGMWLARKLTGSVRAAFLFGLLCALWPGYHEMLFWPNVMQGWKLIVIYLFLLSAWVCFLEKRQWRYYGAVLILYVTLAFAYEVYLPLPAALAALIPWGRNWIKRTVSLMIPFGAGAVFYLAYRFTNAFGYGQNILGTDQAFSSAYVANFWELRHNALSILSWFAGPDLGRTWLDGLLGLGDAGPGMVFGLAVINLGLAWLIWQWFRKPEEVETTMFRPLQVIVFGIVLAACTAGLLVATYPAGRTLFFVAMGLFFAVCVGARLSWRHSSWLVPVIVAVMLSTQGMGKNWEMVARIHRNFRAHLVQHRSEWIDKEVLLVDTMSLRERMGPSLLDPPVKGVFAVTEYRGAGFLRGFGLSQIAARVAGSDGPLPRVLLDVENGAEVQGQRLLWHKRFNPSEKRETPLDQTYIVDLLNASR